MEMKNVMTKFSLLLLMFLRKSATSTHRKLVGSSPSLSPSCLLFTSAPLYLRKLVISSSLSQDKFPRIFRQDGALTQLLQLLESLMMRAMPLEVLSTQGIIKRNIKQKTEGSSQLHYCSYLYLFIIYDIKLLCENQ